MFLSSYAAEVKVLVRGEGLKISMSQYLIDQIASKANIEVLPFTQVVSAGGGNHLERIEVRVQAPHEAEKILGYEADALFVMIGADACTSWLPIELERDPRGYLCTGRDLTTWKLDRQPFPLETSLPGVFCAGDARHNSIKRVSSGVGEGSMAIAFIHQYLSLQKESRDAKRPEPHIADSGERLVSPEASCWALLTARLRGWRCRWQWSERYRDIWPAKGSRCRGRHPSFGGNAPRRRYSSEAGRRRCLHRAMDRTR